VRYSFYWFPLPDISSLEIYIPKSYIQILSVSIACPLSWDSVQISPYVTKNYQLIVFMARFCCTFWKLYDKLVNGHWWDMFNLLEWIQYMCIQNTWLNLTIYKSYCEVSVWAGYRINEHVLLFRMTSCTVHM